MLKAKVTREEWAELPGDVQTHYAEQEDGTYLLDVGVVDGLALEDTSSLKKALSGERSARAKAEKDLKVLRDEVGDLDVAEARTAVEKLAEMTDLDPEELAKTKVAELERQLTSKFEKERVGLVQKHETSQKDLQGRLDSLTAQLARELVGSAASKAISEADGSVELLLPIIRERTRMSRDEESDQMRVEVLDRNGDVRLSPDPKSTEPMSISELVAEMKADQRFGRAFGGTGASGSGASRTRPAPKGGAKVMGSGDPAALGRDLENIASGKTRVDMSTAEGE